MVPHKKRISYKQEATQICKLHNISINLNSWEEIWALLDKSNRIPKQAYLYVIGEVNGNIVKIGKSNYPGRLLKNLQISYPVKLKLWAYCKHESPFTEKEIYTKLREYNIYSKWFKVSSEVRNIIDSIKNYSMNVNK